MSWFQRWFGGRSRASEQARAARVEALAARIDAAVPALAKTRSSAKKLELYGELMEAAEALQALELRGEATISPPPSQILPGFRREREELIRKEIEEIARKTMAASEAATVEKRAAIVQKAVQKAAEWEGLLPEGRVAQPVAELKALLHVARLEAMVEDARRFEFKGEAKRALDLYQEALYMVLNDEVPDAQQQEEIAALDGKIRALSDQVRP